ncbi:MAG: hypothetical protein WC656_01750 [Sulfurimonas sp.]|jgi:hypothetical protein
MDQNSVVKTFRMKRELADKLDTVKAARNEKIQKIITDAIEAYLAQNLGEAKECIKTAKEIKSSMNINEHMLMPIHYYALFNDLALIEVKAQIKRGAIKSIDFADEIFILIDISENLYKKAELLMIKGNVSSVMKELHTLKKRVNKMERTMTGAKIEEDDDE